MTGVETGYAAEDAVPTKLSTNTPRPATFDDDHAATTVRAAGSGAATGNSEANKTEVDRKVASRKRKALQQKSNVTTANIPRKKKHKPTKVPVRTTAGGLTDAAAGALGGGAAVPSKDAKDRKDVKAPPRAREGIVATAADLITEKERKQRTADSSSKGAGSTATTMTIDAAGVADGSDCTDDPAPAPLTMAKEAAAAGNGSGCSASSSPPGSSVHAGDSKSLAGDQAIAERASGSTGNKTVVKRLYKEFADSLLLATDSPSISSTTVNLPQRRRTLVKAFAELIQPSIVRMAVDAMDQCIRFDTEFGFNVIVPHRLQCVLFAATCMAADIAHELRPAIKSGSKFIVSAEDTPQRLNRLVAAIHQLVHSDQAKSAETDEFGMIFHRNISDLLVLRLVAPPRASVALPVLTELPLRGLRTL